MANKITKEEMRITLANNLTALLDQKNKSRKDISDGLKVPYSVACDWVKGRTYPNQYNLGKLAFFLDTTIEQLTTQNSAINEKGFNPENSTSKRKVAVIDIATDEWIKSPVDYEWISTKNLKPNGNYLMFEVVDDLLSPIYNIGDMILAESLDGKILKNEGDYLLSLSDIGSMLFVHVYIKNNGYLVAPLNNNNKKSFLPIFYTNEEFILKVGNIHKAVRVTKNI